MRASVEAVLRVLQGVAGVRRRCVPEGGEPLLQFLRIGRGGPRSCQHRAGQFWRGRHGSPRASPHSICRRVSLGVSPESRAASVRRAWARRAGQPNSARFAAALKSIRCRSPWSSPSRIKSSVARFSRRALSAASARRCPFTSASRSTACSAACQSAAAGCTSRSGRAAEGFRLRCQVPNTVNVKVQQFVEGQAALVQSRLRVSAVRRPEKTHLVVYSAVDSAPTTAARFSANRRATLWKLTEGMDPRTSAAPRDSPLSRKRRGACRHHPGQRVTVQNAGGKPSGIAQGAFGVVRLVDVPPEERAPSKGRRILCSNRSPDDAGGSRRGNQNADR